MILALKIGRSIDEILTRTMVKQRGGYDSGSVTLLRPDGTQYPGSPFTGGCSAHYMKHSDFLPPLPPHFVAFARRYRRCALNFVPAAARRYRLRAWSCSPESPYRIHRLVYTPEAFRQHLGRWADPLRCALRPLEFIPAASAVTIRLVLCRHVLTSLRHTSHCIVLR